MAAVAALSWLLAVGLAVLVSAGPVAQWRISIAWQDESCDDVCRSADMFCTEQCWPSTIKGLENAMSAPEVDGTCFDVKPGLAAAINPAKDPSNTMCYWNAGTPTAPRCPMLPSTPKAKADVGHYTRRLCPCVNTTSAALGAPECGLGGEDAQPAPTGTYAPLEALATTAPGQANSSTAAPAASAILAQSRWAGGTTCQVMCVAGFAYDDARLNGQYSPVGMSVASSFWEHVSTTNVILAHVDGRWQFLQGSSPSRGTAIGTARRQTEMGAGLPSSDYYDTPTGGAYADFRCCMSSGSLASSAFGAGGAEEGGGTDLDTLAAIGAVVGLLLTLAGMAGAAKLCGWKGGPPDLSQLKQMRMSKPFGSCWRSRRYETKSDQDSCRSADVEAPVPPVASERPLAPRPIAPQAAPARELPLQQARRAPAPPVHGTVPQAERPRRAEEDKAAAAVAAMLGGPPGPAPQSILGPGGVYEGPVHRWWEGSQAQRGGELAVGEAVTLRGMAKDPTWDGAEGEIEGIDERTGFIFVRLADGRMKTVRAENCAVAGRPSAAPSRAAPSRAAGPRAAAHGGDRAAAEIAAVFSSGASPQRGRPAAGTTMGRSASADGGPSAVEPPAWMQVASPTRPSHSSHGRAQLPPLSGAPPVGPPSALPGGGASPLRRQNTSGTWRGGQPAGDHGAGAAKPRHLDLHQASRGSGRINPREDALMLNVQAELNGLASRMSDRNARR
mmetsp:Transcript_1228/g.3347  ORF Transcript_1228/g.3347 Transcript_1228/m.3347 type:complete len:727 (+) Transcript_1228:77-2257(+)